MITALVAATRFEIGPTLKFLEGLPPAMANQLNVIITGVGNMAATWHVAHALAETRYDLMLQAGIGGSFTETLPLTQAVLISDETLGDTGVEENGLFRDLYDMGFSQEHAFPFTGKSLVNPHLDRWHALGLPVTRGLTVNEISTRPERISQLKQIYNAGIESMEGAGFHYVCLQEGVPFLQLRAVSNQVGERDKSRWNLPGALESLNRELISIIKQLIHP